MWALPVPGGEQTDNDTIDITINPVDDGPATGLVINGLTDGNAVEQQVLTANVTGLSDPDGLPASPSYSYQWQQSTDGGTTWGNITGATSASFTPDDADVNALLRVRVTYTDGQDFSNTIESDPTGPVLPVNDGVGTSTVAFTGTSAEDNTLTADISGISDPDGQANATFSYEWQQSPTETGGTWTPIGTNATLNLGEAQANQYVRLVITYEDDQGFTETLTSTPSLIASSNDGPATGLLITGDIAEDQVLGTNFDSITDPDGKASATPTYQW
jgi:hypothetical protein